LEVHQYHEDPKRQASVQTSTFGAEFTALKKAVEEGITLRNYLRSMGIKVAKPTPFLGTT
jgi:hypothetical protein